ncbi:hypothetical protein ACFE04_000033 [Oxalis oulophora]
MALLNVIRMQNGGKETTFILTRCQFHLDEVDISESQLSYLAQFDGYVIHQQPSRLAVPRDAPTPLVQMPVPPGPPPLSTDRVVVRKISSWQTEHINRRCIRRLDKIEKEKYLHKQIYDNFRMQSPPKFFLTNETMRLILYVVGTRPASLNEDWKYGFIDFSVGVADIDARRLRLTSM